MSFSSLRAAAKALTQREKVVRLDLSSSGDLQCKMIMCEKLGGACACRLARFVEQAKLHLTQLEALDVSESGLDVLPTPVFESLPALSELRAHDNKLKAVPGEVKLSRKLEILDLRNNQLTELPMAELKQLLPGLKEVQLGGNPPELRHAVEVAAKEDGAWSGVFRF